MPEAAGRKTTRCGRLNECYKQLMADLASFRLILALAVVGVFLTSCGAGRPEQVLAHEAGRRCGINPERICVSTAGGELAGRFGVSLYTGGYEIRPQDIPCLAGWANEKGFNVFTAPVARCMTENELDVADAAASACAIPPSSLRVERRQNSWLRSSTAISSAGVREDVYPTAIDCLDAWTEARGYYHQRPLRLH